MYREAAAHHLRDALAMMAWLDPRPGTMNHCCRTAQLYNMKDDIGESRNLAAAHPDRVKELTGAWRRWNAQLAKRSAGRPPVAGRGGGAAAWQQ
jgi:hypothetical protein